MTWHISLVHPSGQLRAFQAAASFGRYLQSNRVGLQKFYPQARHLSSSRPLRARAEPIPHTKLPPNTIPTLYKFAGIAGVGLGFSLFTAPRIFCEPVNPRPASPAAATANPALPPAPPTSRVSYYELTFGTVCGVCAGVFVKKGAKALAFVFGGVFVLLQYLGSMSLVRVDWGRAASRFENLFYTVDAGGVRRAPNVGSLFRWIVDFLTADFQQRASFVTGFALGLRIG